MPSPEIIILEPFNALAPCAACRGTAWQLEYVDSRSRYKVAGGMTPHLIRDPITPHIEATCRRCKYLRRMQCAERV